MNGAEKPPIPRLSIFLSEAASSICSAVEGVQQVDYTKATPEQSLVNDKTRYRDL